jgi:hypothetical protein
LHATLDAASVSANSKATNHNGFVALHQKAHEVVEESVLAGFPLRSSRITVGSLDVARTGFVNAETPTLAQTHLRYGAFRLLGSAIKSRQTG